MNLDQSDVSLSFFTRLSVKKIDYTVIIYSKLSIRIKTKQNLMKKYFFLTICLLGFIINQELQAQAAGYSSASVSMNRSNGIISADQVIVEEYVNYHRHQIPLPKPGKDIALDLRWNSLNQEEILLQVGITSKRILDYSEMPPINTSIVIDRSGSMAGDQKLEKVKRALLKFVEGLRSEDWVSIVIYDNEASVILPAQKVKEIPHIKMLVQGLSPGGSTNLHDGLMLGYKEVMKHFNPKISNRVILLTDGIANEGVTNPEEIVKNSGIYNKKGIDVSTIGVGEHLNYTLLQQIARQGKGLNHFIGTDEEDIIKVFDQELESLLSPLGKEVLFELDFPQGLALKQIYGYSPSLEKNKIKIPLNTINAGLTQVILMTFKKTGMHKAYDFSAQLQYTKSGQQNTHNLSQKIRISTSNQETPSEWNTEILKNYTIARMANALKEAASQFGEKKYMTANTTLGNILSTVEQEFPYLKDADIIRVKEILEKNYKNIAKTLVHNSK